MNSFVRVVYIFDGKSMLTGVRLVNGPKKPLFWALFKDKTMRENLAMSNNGLNFTACIPTSILNIYIAELIRKTLY